MYTEMVPEKVCRQRPRGGSQGKRPATAWPRQTAYHTIVQPTYTRGPRAALALAGSDNGETRNSAWLGPAGRLRRANLRPAGEGRLSRLAPPRHPAPAPGRARASSGRVTRPAGRR